MVRRFTIMELLVAITITVVAVNLLSTLYVRANTLAISQTEVQATTRRGMAALDFLNNEFRNLVIPIANSWDPGNDEASDVQYPIFMGNVYQAGDPDPYPGIIFHRQRTTYGTEPTSIVHPIEEVAIFLAPPELGFNKDPYLSIYRVTNDEYDEQTQSFTDSLFGGADENEIPVARYNSREVIVDKVIGMYLSAKYFDVIDSSFKSTEQLYTIDSHTLEAFEIAMTLAPPSTQIELKNSTIDRMEYDTTSEYVNLIGDNQDISDFITEKGFYFQDRGHFANFTTGQVFRFTRSGTNSGQISIDKVMENACTALEDGLITGFTFQRHFTVR